MNTVIATYFAFVVCAMIFIFSHVRNKLKDNPLNDADKNIVKSAYAVIWALIACFSLLAYKFYTL